MQTICAYKWTFLSSVSGLENTAETSFFLCYPGGRTRVPTPLIYVWLYEKEQQWRPHRLSEKLRSSTRSTQSSRMKKGKVVWRKTACCIRSVLIDRNIRRTNNSALSLCSTWELQKMFFLKGSLKKWEPFLTFVCQSVIAHYLHIQCRTQPQMWSIEGLVQGYNFHYVFLYPDCDCIYFVKLSPSDGGRSTRFSSEVDNIFHPSSTIKSRRGSFSEKISDVIYKLVINLSRATSIFVRRSSCF